MYQLLYPFRCSSQRSGHLAAHLRPSPPAPVRSTGYSYTAQATRVALGAHPMEPPPEYPHPSRHLACAPAARTSHTCSVQCMSGPVLRQPPRSFRKSRFKYSIETYGTGRSARAHPRCHSHWPRPRAAPMHSGARGSRPPIATTKHPPVNVCNKTLHHQLR
jgi:hypothetical protein